MTPSEGTVFEPVLSGLTSIDTDESDVEVSLDQNMLPQPSMSHEFRG